MVDHDSEMTADGVVAALEALRSEAELVNVRKRLGPDEAAIGLRMRDLFATAKAHERLPLPEVDRLLDHPAYEPRMAAMCILDFKARRRFDDDGRAALYEMYMGRHDRITTWDMVDRSAPRVVGGHLAGRSAAPLHEQAGSPDPLRRRTAMTAPLYFVMSGSDADVAEGFAIAATLATDPAPVVHKPVGIFLKHATGRDPDAVESFLAIHARSMPRPAVRLAAEKLAPTTRARYVP
jgi:3-methyladenine DNA glycosylase AlkD